jgi:LPXTG-motif cell wall-anchored protein
MRKLFIAFIAFTAAALAFVAWVPAAGAAQTSVAITGTGCASAKIFCFSPANVTIHDGDAVVWTNQSGAPHTVTRCSSAACAGTAGGTGTDTSFTSGSVGSGNGGTFSHTFHGPGTYVYFCQIHGFAVMHGTVTVLASSTGPTTPVTTAASSGSMQPTSASSSPRASNRALPRTGVTSWLWASAGGALLVAGAVLALAGRRRNALSVVVTRPDRGSHDQSMTKG